MTVESLGVTVVYTTLRKTSYEYGTWRARCYIDQPQYCHCFWKEEEAVVGMGLRWSVSAGCNGLSLQGKEPIGSDD